MVGTSPDLAAVKIPTSKLRIIAAIPCYNTQKYIADVVSRTLKYVDEVIVVDDGSDDMTALEASAAGASVIRHNVNQGKGAAMKTAANYAESDIIVFLDGDGQHNPDEIPELVSPLLQGRADFVIGSRYLSGSMKLSAPFLRKIANLVAAFVISLVISIGQPLARFVFRLPPPEKLPVNPLFGVIDYRKNKLPPGSRILAGGFKKISDCTSGFTAMKTTCWQKLNLISDGFQIETEIIFEQAR
ncbi:MAG: glycosyltransferase family 2 protein, partial [Dehalococcoidales bacterium]|nr:glycosyltransferase family 2 protein [Dehalococcoidales bacterium]